MKPINTALCSFGMSGWVFHAPFVTTNSKFNFYGVWERTKNLAQEKYPGVKTFRTLEELLADKNVELVVVNTPSVTHYDYAKQTILAGKHLIVEKPFTATVEQAQELIELAKSMGIKLGDNHPQLEPNKRVPEYTKPGIYAKAYGVVGSIDELRTKINERWADPNYIGAAGTAEIDGLGKNVTVTAGGGIIIRSQAQSPSPLSGRYS